MNRIKTKSFELAVITAGDSEAEKLVLCLPGRLDTKDYLHMVGLVDDLGQAGYFAMSFDPPGTWGSGGEIGDYTTTNYIKAINEVIEVLGQEKVALVGHSRGGSTALTAGLENDRVTHVVAIMSHLTPSVYDPDRVEHGVIKSERDVPGKENGDKKIFDLPLNYFEDCAQYDATDLVRESSKPKFFIYATEDKAVAAEDVKEAYEIAANPKEIYELDFHHDYRRDKRKIVEVNEAVLAFFKKHNF